MTPDPLRCFGGPLDGQMVAAPGDRLLAAVPASSRSWIVDLNLFPASPSRGETVTYHRRRLMVDGWGAECWVEGHYPVGLVLDQLAAIVGLCRLAGGLAFGPGPVNITLRHPSGGRP